MILDIGCCHVLDPSGMRAYRNQVKRLLAPGGTYMIYLFFKMESKNTKPKGSNATEADLVPFLDFMDLVKRENGTDRGNFRSAWITYRK